LLTLGGCGKEASPADSNKIVAQGDVTNATVILFKDERGNVLFYNSDIEQIYAIDSKELGYFIEIEMTNDGAKKLEDATESLVGQNMKMYMGDVPIISAMVVAPIEDGRFILCDHTTQEEMLIMFDKLTK
jgi:hypothetical protein